MSEDLQLRIRVSEILKDLGVPVHLSGYKYLQEAVVIGINYPDIFQQTVKGLYPEVAKNTSSTASRVERAMRHAIEVAFDKGDPEIIYKYFGGSVSSSKGKATNKAFLATIIEWIQMDRDR